MSMYLTNGTILHPDHGIVDGHALQVADGRIAGIVRAGDVPAGAITVDLGGNLLAPGFVDLQCNGGGGVLFNDDPSVAALRAISAAHSRFGTTAFLPTLISDDLPTMQRALLAVNEAMAAGVPGIVGIHLEGPFLNTERKGIHDSAKIRPLTAADVDVILADRPATTLVTLAPELAPPDQLGRLRDAAVLICAGHTNATFEQTMQAFASGVSGVTHLFNAMSPLRAREPGAVGAALLSPECWCCIIVDGEHVHPAALQLALRVKGSSERFILVTDAMPTVGQAVKEFVLNGETITAHGGVCQNSGGTLAGSDLDMAQAVAKTVALLGVDRAEAIGMASANPARYLGLDDRFGTLAPGLAANLVELAPDGAVRRTWIDGTLVWDAAAG
ncbi:N-acetylglucosamine-6-phosphate deacetylase [Sphingomonas hylomeconis]|uniref:N-acetylglucosamine-6-phosphate deacetylase n=1 Tax=Sphingomonas hylomeconis TaxID=1395958 RepID=A0ABV7SZC0_9SPHN|nr:N-acetylglucosamine-6-phosphate deacetylase [Sphingomonas hylomeconis]